MRKSVFLTTVIISLLLLYVFAYTNTKEESKEKTEDLSSVSPVLLGEDFGLGGDFRFGQTFNFEGSNGDFPMNEARRFFTSRYYGINQNLTAYKNGDKLNYPEGDDFELDFYLNIKEKDPNIKDDFSIMGFVSLNFETALTGTTSSTGALSNRFYARDLFVEIQDLLVRDLKIWFGDRKRAGYSLFLTSFRPSQDDVRLRGFGFEYRLQDKIKVCLDLGTHWFLKATRSVSSQSTSGNKIVDEFVGYVPQDSFGNPLTYDYYTFVDDANQERLRRIFTTRLRVETGLDGTSLDDSNMIVGGYFVFEYVPRSPGGKYISTSNSANYNQLRTYRENDVDELEFPNDYGFKGGVDVNISLGDNILVRGGVGYASGISVNPMGPSLEYLQTMNDDLNKLPSEQNYNGAEAKKLENQRALTLGFGVNMWIMEDLNIMFDLANRFGNFGGKEDEMTSISADYKGNAAPTLTMVSTRATYFYEQYQVGLSLSYESVILTDGLMDQYRKATDSGDAAYFSGNYEFDFNDKHAFMVRAFLLPGISLEKDNVVDGNMIYFPIGVTMMSRSAQMIENLGRKVEARTQWYTGVQSHIKF